jgi:two-component system cell cycle response regulator
MLPLCDFDLHTEPARRPGRNTTDPGLRILIMSDSDSNALFLSHMAQISGSSGIHIETNNRLASGAKRVHEAGIDLVLLDLDLADSSGLESFSRLSTLVPRTPIVVVAKMGEEALAQEAVKCGAQDYLIKEQVTPHVLAHSMRCAIERHRQLLQLKELSMTDPLTGLYNRRGFWALADSHIKMTRRQRRRSLILCADLDGLKLINDMHGHDEGDRAIMKTAEVLRDCFRESDIVARFGGDEFVTLAYDTVSGSEQTLTGRIRSRLKRASETTKRGYELSLSIGTAVVNGGRETGLEELLDKADRALYRNKRKKYSRRPAGRSARSHTRRPADVLTLLHSAS